MDWRQQLSNLAVTTPILTLQVADDQLLDSLGEVAANNIHPDTFEKSPFRSRWDHLDSSGRKNYIVTRQQELWKDFRAENWSIPLVIVFGDVPVGEVIVRAQRFQEYKTFSTASWVGESHRRQGIGIESRVAALQLGFETFMAERALSQSFVENEAAMAISHKLSYQISGATPFIHGRGPIRRLMYYRLGRRLWEAKVRRKDIELCVPNDLSFLEPKGLA